MLYAAWTRANRLRMAVHAGQVRFDHNGVTGREVIHLFRLLDAPAFRSAFAATPASLGLVASDHVYREAIQPTASTGFPAY